MKCTLIWSLKTLYSKSQSVSLEFSHSTERIYSSHLFGEYQYASFGNLKIIQSQFYLIVELKQSNIDSGLVKLVVFKDFEQSWPQFQSDRFRSNYFFTINIFSKFLQQKQLSHIRQIISSSNLRFSMPKRLNKKECISHQNPQLISFLNSTFSYCSIPEVKKFIKIQSNQQLREDQQIKDRYQSPQKNLFNIRQEQLQEQKLTFKHTSLDNLGQNLCDLDSPSENLPGGIKVLQEDSLPRTFIYYLVSGQLDLQKISQKSSKLNIKYGKREKQIERTPKIQVKQNNYFTLVNYRNLKVKENFCAICKSNTSNIIRIEIFPGYGYSWYKQKYQKIALLADIFLDRKDQSMKSTRFKQLSKIFTCQKYRRGSNIIKQGEHNQKIVIIKSGQCQISKICQIRSNSAQEQLKKSTILQKKQNQSQISDQNKLVYKENRKVKIAIAQKPSIFSCQHFIFQNQKMVKIITGLSNQAHGYQIYQGAINNFTLTAYSAFVETLEAPIGALTKHMLSEWKVTLIKNGMSFYITLLRQSQQVIKRSVHHLQCIQQKKQQEKQLLKARMHSGFYSQPKSDNINSSPNRKMIKKSEMNRYQDMQQNKVATLRSQNLSKRIQIVLNGDYNKNDKHISKNFKVKIEDLLRQKLVSNELKKSTINNKKQENRLDQQFTKDLEDIFMVDNGYRSQSIKRHNGMLHMKEQLLKKRYSNIQSKLVIDQQQYDSRNKIIRSNLIRKGVYTSERPNQINYLKGLKIGSFTENIRNKCAEKINNVNKIKEQFMKIKSQCDTCHCYDNLDHFHSTQRDSMRLTRIGTGWRTASLRNTYDSKFKQQEPLEKAHNKVKFLSQKTKMKYSHKQHLQKKMKRAASVGQRKFSNPLY